ncbi:DUF6907 domain-containing protein [Nonomuraea sp. LPB2021202275-12-8]|uniref:DUF6907 domain-containing protein n=1 Tax=Nonomuraea sp. LPB2021202275-12-8 TaxID=3120159 RepID=UPI00300D46A0
MSDHITAQAATDSLSATTQPLPEAWARDAIEAGKRAADSVRFQYVATMRALQRQRESGESPYWLASHPCPPWCRNTGTHLSSDSPEDRAHDSEVHAVQFDSMEPSTAFADFRAPEMTFQLTLAFREVEARVFVEFEGEHVAAATLDEAERIARSILSLVEQARGGWRPAIIPFDHEGKCSDITCVSCYPLPGLSTGESA